MTVNAKYIVHVLCKVFEFYWGKKFEINHIMAGSSGINFYEIPAIIDVTAALSIKKCLRKIDQEK